MTLDFVMYIVATCWVTHTSPRLLAGRKMLAGVAALGALTLGFASIRVSSHALLTGALFSGLLAAGFLLGAWHYVLDVEERWHIRLWVRTAKTS
jgi:hypothetical protein